MFSIIARKAEGSFHRYKRVTQLAQLLHQEKKAIKGLIDHIEHNEFFTYIKNKMRLCLHYTPSKHDFMYTSKTGSIFFPCVTLYALVRSMRPQIVIETGGTPGKSSAGILKALQENNNGHLYTLDLPPTTSDAKFNASHLHSIRPVDDISCWAIDPQLRNRHTLIFGDTKKTLLPLLQQTKQCEIFIHDSDHSYEHMMFEFETSWDFIKQGGFLISDDIRTNLSFSDFAKKVNTKAYSIGNYGILIKK